MAHVEVEEARTCGTCGMLGLRRQSDDALLDAPYGFREEATVGKGYTGGPVCAVRVRNFQFETDQIRPRPEGTDLQNVRLDMLRQDQSECEDWTRWIEGLTPKDHIEMVDRYEYRQREREWRRDELRVQQEIVAIARETASINRSSVRVALVGIFVAALVGVAAIVFRDGGTTINNDYGGVMVTPQPTVSP